MELYDEDDIKKGKKGKKVVTSLLIISVILLIVLGIVMVLVPKNIEIKTTLTLDGKPVTIPEGLFYTSEDGTSYISIRDFATLIGYEYYRGEYNDKYTESNNKCYVQNANEATSFILGSGLVYKTEPNDELKYEYYTLSKPVISKNNKLYASIDAINVAFNCMLKQNVEQKTINVYTLSYLYDFYEKSLKNNYGYTLSTTETVIDGREEKQVQKIQSFTNQKALAYGMAVVNKNNKFGVISTSGETIIGTKYDNINFVEERQEFIVTSDEKLGLLSSTGQTQINLEYDSLKLLDGMDDYYLVKQNSKYGIVRADEETVVPIELDDISYNIVNNKKIYYLRSGEKVLTLEDYLEEL